MTMPIHSYTHSVGLLVQGMWTHVATKLKFPPPSRAPLFGLSAGLILGALSMPATADDVITPAMMNSRFVLGATLISSSEYPGSDRSKAKLRPILAYQYGRWRLSSSHASAVLGFATDAAGPGASAELFGTKNLHVGAALRFDGGRKAGNSPDLRGLPDVPRTLRGRIYASYALNKQWSIGGNVSQDLMGRGGGALVSSDLSYRYWITPHVEWYSSIGATLADKRNMTTYFGISAAQASQSGLRPFAAGSGFRDVHLGTGLMMALTPHWIAFGNVGGTRLLADAAHSPLTRRSTSVGATLGIAYRN
ncbi:MAG: MipA/OmpV family protein [Pseudomonadota bacterium]